PPPPRRHLPLARSHLAEPRHHRRLRARHRRAHQHHAARTGGTGAATGGRAGTGAGSSVSRVYVSVVIDAPPGDVWSVVEPIERHVDWMADAAPIRVGGPQRRGRGTPIAVETRL